MSLRHINASEAKRLVDQGAILIDVREHGEYAAENIPGAHNHPMSRMGYGPLEVEAPMIVFHCKSGGRTRMGAAALARCAKSEAYILDGGIDAWKAAGLPVKRG
jgi:rhodanese-related sulfurtransferase